MKWAIFRAILFVFLCFAWCGIAFLEGPNVQNITMAALCGLFAIIDIHRVTKQL